MYSTPVFWFGVSPFFGYGVLGLNMMKYFPEEILCAAEINLKDLEGLSPFTVESIKTRIQKSVTIAQIMAQNPSLEYDGVVMQPLDGIRGPDPKLLGSKNVGMAFIEKTTPRDPEGVKKFDQIIVGSTWNRDYLRSHGVENVELVFQGIDPTIFHPAPRANYFKNRFAEFSGGKMEYRKGQDLVVLAFKEFAKRHKDAVLVTQWSSPWPEFAASLNESGLAEPIRPQEPQFQESWLKANGIPPEQFVVLPMVPNYRMGEVVREMDVAIFPNRCEGGTNLVAMECIACGVPTICSANTGHLDLIREGWATPLREQWAIQREGGSDGWGEPDVGEMVEELEMAYRFRDRKPSAEALERGTVSEVWTWERQIAELHKVMIRS
jgi:glycosyltransferase involved in cell wall biosynthesis